MAQFKFTDTKAKRLITPAAIARYPWLNRPSDKFGEAQYKVELVLDPTDEKVKTLLDELTTLSEAAVAEAQAKETNKLKAKSIQAYEVIHPDADKEGNESGKVVLKFKMKAQVISRSTGEPVAQRPALVDCKGKPVDPGKAQIAGGSTLRVAFLAAPFYNAATKQAGITLMLNAVQIVNLVEFRSGPAFGECEGSFVVDEDNNTKGGEGTENGSSDF